VVASNIATITNIEIEELTDVNAITINVTGPGEYEYSLDDQFGFTKIQIILVMFQQESMKYM
jgi:hypothetical protein